MPEIIRQDPEELRDRLNQPPTTRLEKLEQVRATVPLSPSAERDYQRMKRASRSGLPVSAS